MRHYCPNTLHWKSEQYLHHVMLDKIIHNAQSYVGRQTPSYLGMNVLNLLPVFLKKYLQYEEMHIFSLLISVTFVLSVFLHALSFPLY